MRAGLVLAGLLSALALVACTSTIEGGDGGSGGSGGSGGAGGSGAGNGADGGDPGTAACRVLELMQTKCVSCHANPPVQSAPMPLTTLDMLRAPSLRDGTQSNAQRSLVRMADDQIPMPPAPVARATPEEQALVATWLASGAPNCATADGGTPAPVNPNLIPQGELFTCGGELSDAPTRVRRLNRWQWTRNVGGPVTRSWTGFSFFDNPFDPSSIEPYPSYATDETVDESMVEIVLPIVSEYGDTWAGPYTGSNRLALLRNDQSLRCMWDDDVPSPACRTNYLRTLLERGVYYRPPRTDELARLSTFTDTVLAAEVNDGGQDNRTHSLNRIVTAAMLTSGALFREELGTATDAGRVNLTHWELAGQLAYALGDRGPGAVPTYRFPDESATQEGHYADIAGAARDGGIGNSAVVDALVDKYFGGNDPTRFDLVADFDANRRARRGEYWLGDGVANFFRSWLGYKKVEEIFKERPEATSQYDDGDTSVYRAQLSAWSQQMDGYYGYESVMTAQMDDFVARAVQPDVQVLSTLLTTRNFFLPATMNSGFDGNQTRYTGQPYGTTVVIDANTPSQRWQSLPAAERAGVLTHPAWLASHGGNFEDDPSAVHRGKWVREQLLCGYVPPLSEVKVVAMVGPHAPDKNARARLETATASIQCQGCHGLMNPLGLPFEIYNHAGYLRAQDHAPDGGFMPPDGRSALSGMPDPALDGPVLNAVELSQKLAASGHVKRCFIRHVFRYFMGRNENRTDACTLVAMEQAYDQSNGSMRALLKSLANSPTWTTRRNPEAGE